MASNKQIKEQFEVHNIEWTPETASRYWNHYVKFLEEKEYFGAENGERILAYARKHIKDFGLVLDYGCGPGGFLTHLLSRGISCKGLDFSKDSVERVEQRWAEQPSFRGAIYAESLPTPLGACSIDTLFCVEVVEHLPTRVFDKVIQEFARVLKAGGFLIVTTPNEEDLRKNEVLCPECGCSYHRYQHVRSWDRKSLEIEINDHGFRTVVCSPTSFRPNTMLSRIITYYKFLTGALQRQLPHLIYIGERE